MFLAIDPGEHPGYAVLSDKLELVWCGIQAPGSPNITCFRPSVVLCERPTVYPKMKVDPANIITLAITAGKLVQPWLEAGAKEAWVEPRTWKGNIPKDIHHASIFSKLSTLEQDVVSRCLKGVAPTWREDAMDAVGLAMYGKRMHIFQA
jgi:hypothetical protein